MHTTVYEKHRKSCACGYVQMLANVIAWCPFVDAVHAMAGSTN